MGKRETSYCDTAELLSVEANHGNPHCTETWHIEKVLNFFDSVCVCVCVRACVRVCVIVV